jgi:hypothetical protein
MANPAGNEKKCASDGRRRTARRTLNFVLLAAVTAGAAQLKQDTIQAFDRYVKITDEERAAAQRKTGAFLWIDRQPEKRRQQLLEKLNKGEVVVERLETRDDNRRIQIPYGIVHHWIGATFIPGATTQQTIALMENYGNYPELFKFGVDRSKIKSREGDNFQVQFRIFRKGGSSIFYNVDLDDRYSRPDASRAFRRTRSTRIAELADAGKPAEHELPVGDDRGFLWRLNIDWSCEEKNGGVYLQAELIALSRGLPAMFAWLVNPYVRGIPQEYLEKILGAMRWDLTAKPAVPERPPSPR